MWWNERLCQQRFHTGSPVVRFITEPHTVVPGKMKGELGSRLCTKAAAHYYIL